MLTIDDYLALGARVASYLPDLHNQPYPMLKCTELECAFLLEVSKLYLTKQVQSRFLCDNLAVYKMNTTNLRNRILQIMKGCRTLSAYLQKYSTVLPEEISKFDFHYCYSDWLHDYRYELRIVWIAKLLEYNGYELT
jgi:hypothetical protein